MMYLPNHEIILWYYYSVQYNISDPRPLHDPNLFIMVPAQENNHHSHLDPISWYFILRCWFALLWKKNPTYRTEGIIAPKLVGWDDVKCCLIYARNSQKEMNFVKEKLPEEIKSGIFTKNVRSLFFHYFQKNVHNNWFWVVLTWCGLILKAGASWRKLQSQLNWWLPILPFFMPQSLLHQRITIPLISFWTERKQSMKYKIKLNTLPMLIYCRWGIYSLLFNCSYWFFLGFKYDGNSHFCLQSKVAVCNFWTNKIQEDVSSVQHWKYFIHSHLIASLEDANNTKKFCVQNLCTLLLEKSFWISIWFFLFYSLFLECWCPVGSFITITNPRKTKRRSQIKSSLQEGNKEQPKKQTSPTMGTRTKWLSPSQMVPDFSTYLKLSMQFWILNTDFISYQLTWDFVSSKEYQVNSFRLLILLCFV